MDDLRLKPQQTAKRRVNRQRNASLSWEDKGWIDQELDGAYFWDARLGKRLRTLFGLMSNGLRETIPLACQEWANTKAAYRFFSNPRLTREEILSGHFASTQARATAIPEAFLVLPRRKFFEASTQAAKVEYFSPPFCA